MMQSRAVEIWVGVFVVAGMAALFMLAMRASNLSTVAAGDGYALTARFENVSGLTERAPVTLGGVRIGRVTSIGLDEQYFEALVTMQISRDIGIPADSVAGVYTSGLLGEKYIGIKPGVEEQVLGPGDNIKGAQSSLVLEELIGKFLFDRASEGPAP